MNLLFILAVLVMGVYCAFIIWVAVNFKVTPAVKGNISDSVSIIIPCRNEAENIMTCLASIGRQSIGKNRFEIILVDDFSEDNTVELAGRYSVEFPLTILKNRNPGKKNALNLGIAYSQNDTIVTTDADCTMHPDWLSTMLNEFSDRKLSMLCGPVRFNDSGSVFERLQQAESMAIIGISAVMLNTGKPATCNGANLMFSKSVFNDIGGYGKLISLHTGDDDLLMHDFYGLDQSRVGYSMNIEAMVNTQSCTDLRGLLNQRARWLVKRKHYRYGWNGGIQMLVLCQFLLIGSFFISGFWALAMIIVKFTCELIYGLRLKPAFRFNYALILLMPFFQCYILLLFLKSWFIIPHWKGRKLKG
jgi:biofilm PGA synthesis N-glycosyltransferase PgaC